MHWPRKPAAQSPLDDLEDIYIAEKRLADIRAGRVKTIPLEEVMKEYDMVD
jgi:RHH-type rel operon transcriptional repressor/antitoxin RelB